jgi:2-polyprenyl-3-methyl-5-hydroxy-6-metoxy-1,4-benzoquinol methylase
MNNSNIKQTIDAYNKNAESYAKKFDNYEIYQNKISDFQEKYIPKGAKVLDLGCGPGNNIKTILGKDETCFFTGVDLSEKFINIAKTRFPQFTFLKKDIRFLEMNEQFEVVVASFCIVHLTNEETKGFLKNLSKLAAANCYIYLSYMNGEKSGFESTSFSKEEIFFNYYEDEFIFDLIARNNIHVLELGKEEYIESDGAITTDTFIYAIKN